MFLLFHHARVHGAEQRKAALTMNASLCSSGHRRGERCLCRLNQPLAGRRNSHAGDNTLSSSCCPLYITLDCRETISRQAAPQQAQLSLMRSFTALALALPTSQLLPPISPKSDHHRQTETMTRQTASQEDLLKAGRKPKTVTWTTTIHV